MAKYKFGDIDLYALIGVDIEATQSDIRKAYRKKALDCHPDKNPDNPKAAELFHELSKALEVLSDESARNAYNKILRAKKASEIRNKQLDSKRQKLKSDLEKREQEATLNLQRSQPYSTAHKTDEEIFAEEMERLRKEGSKLVEEEHKLMQEQLKKEKLFNLEQNYDSSHHRIKIKWNAHKEDSQNGGYNTESLANYLKKYGDISGLAMSTKKGSAIVEFKTQEGGEMAIAYEKGNMENPLKLKWIGQPPVQSETVGMLQSPLDFEDLVLRKMRQAEERKRLIEQMLKEDEV